MDFEAFATEELTALAKKLSDAVDARVNAATAALADSLRAEADAEIASARTQAELEVARTREDAEAEVARARVESEAEMARIRDEAATEAARIRAEAESEIVSLKTAGDRETARIASEGSAYSAAIEKLRTTQTQVEAENERLAAENAALIWERQELRDSAQTSPCGTLIARLATVFEGVASATTVKDVLTAAATGLDGDFARVAVFTVHDNRLVLTHRRGFDIDSGIEKVVVALGVESFLSDAIQADEVRVLHRDALSGPAPFGGSPALIVTASIAVRGETLGIIYADDSGQTLDAVAGQESVKLAGLLRGHAALKLERLTIELKATAELRAYAQMLIDEVEYIYDADTTSGKPDAERVGRLDDNLRCARQIYRQRVTLEGPATATLLDDIILHILDRKADTAFGRELGAVLVRGAAPDQRQRAAQAS